MSAPKFPFSYRFWPIYRWGHFCPPPPAFKHKQTLEVFQKLKNILPYFRLIWYKWATENIQKFVPKKMSHGVIWLQTPQRTQILSTDSSLKLKINWLALTLTKSIVALLDGSGQHTSPCGWWSPKLYPHVPFVMLT